MCVRVCVSYFVECDLESVECDIDTLAMAKELTVSDAVFVYQVYYSIINLMFII